MYVTMTREELRDMLEVSESALKNIVKRNQLEKRIQDMSYKLISSYKVGRNTVYDLEPLDKDLWKEFQNYYKVKKRDEHKVYTQYRLEDGMQKSRGNIITEQKLNISPSTAKKFDEILVNEGAMKKGPVAYRLLDKNTHQFIEISKEEYLNFWSNKRNEKSVISQARLERNKRLITERDYENRISMATQYAEQDGQFAYCFDTYVELENAQKILNMLHGKK